MPGRRRSREGSEKFADGSKVATDAGRIRSSALGLLARREHSAAELKGKLESRGFDESITGEVLVQLASKGLLSDERYVASFIAHHAGRGQGPVRIRASLREAGVAEELIERLLAEAEVDWAAIARGVRQKKFKGLPASYLERAKQARFLQYRGFSQDQIRAALGPEAGDFDADPSGDRISDEPGSDE